MKSKQIAIVVKYFPSISETFIVNQINALKAIGYNVTLYAYHKVEGIPIHSTLHEFNLLNEVNYFVQPPKAKIKRLFTFFQWVVVHLFSINWRCLFKCLNVFKHGKDAYTLKLCYESQWFMLKHKFDIIHAHFGMNGNRIAYLKAKGIIPKSQPLITTFHGYDMMPNQIDKYKSIYKYLFEEANAFTVNTRYLQNLLLQASPNKIPIHILPVGLDTKVFEQSKETKDNSYFNVVFCGRFIMLKGPDLAVDILNRLLELGYKQVRLHLIGSGKLLHTLEQQISAYDIGDYVFLHSTMKQESIVKFYEQCDVFILPGRYDENTGRAETQGLVIQEAQAMELPVVVSDAGGMKYGLIDGETGFVVKAGDVDGFVRAIEKLLNDSELKLSMGKKGRQFVEQYYDNRVLVKQLEAIYKSVLKM